MTTTGPADGVLVPRSELRSDPRYVRGRRRVADVGVVADQFRPDRYDLMGAAIRLVDVTVILYAPRAN